MLSTWRVLASAALGCAATFASQAIGGRSSVNVETDIGCWAGAMGSTLQLGAWSSLLFGSIVAVSQALATYATQGLKKP